MYCCCCYHKGTYFQANHNKLSTFKFNSSVVVATTKVRIFKQITTVKKIVHRTRQLLLLPQRYVFSSKSQHIPVNSGMFICCCCYHKGTYFQANHNPPQRAVRLKGVVVATTKVRIFKQITTAQDFCIRLLSLLLLPQRYVFSSKSQQYRLKKRLYSVVVATTKVRIFKQITTKGEERDRSYRLLLLPQRYVFSSKSQRGRIYEYLRIRCCCYHKGTYFQANHN